MSQSSVLTPTPQQRLAFARWLVATGDVDEGEAERDAFCVRCRRPLALTPVQYALVAQGLPIVHAKCGMPQVIGGGVVAMTITETRTVRIPACTEHQGFYSRLVTLPWVCPTCGGPRGEPYDGLSYDGSRRLGVHCWENPCGHIDYYVAVRAEADAQAVAS